MFKLNKLKPTNVIAESKTISKCRSKDNWSFDQHGCYPNLRSAARAVPDNISALSGSIFLGQQSGLHRDSSSAESSDKTWHDSSAEARRAKEKVNRTTEHL
jgi:hypothetical protein